MLSVILVFVASIVASFKSDNKRLLVCLAVLVPALLHVAIFSGSGDFTYYVTAGCASLIVISLLEFLPRSPLIVDIQLINFAYIIVHAAGFAMFHAYMEPMIYNALVLVLFVTEFTRLLLTTDKDIKHGIRDRDDSFCNHGFSRRIGDTD